MTKGQLAKSYFESGANCAVAVALAFKEEMGLTEEQIKKLIIGFGGGFGRQRLVCGAVSGFTMVLGYLKSDGEDKLAIYKIIQDASAEFKERLGSLICGDLLDGKVKVTTNAEPDARTPEYYKKRPCSEIVEMAGDITEKYLAL